MNGRVVYSQNVVVVVTPQRQRMTARERNDRIAENKMFYMGLTLSTISIVSRLLAVFTYVYNFLFYTSDGFVIAPVVFCSIQTFVPFTCIFVFYFFNKAFRQEFKKRLARLKCKIVVKINC